MNLMYPYFLIFCLLFCDGLKLSSFPTKSLLRSTFALQSKVVNSEVDNVNSNINAISGITRKRQSKNSTPSIDLTSEHDRIVSDVFQKFLAHLEELDKNSNNPDENHRSETLNGVVRIYCTHSPPNFSMPWQRKKQEFSTSSGFMIEGNRILTNAHAVEYGALIQVKKHQSENKFLASVVAVGHECDLAILSVEDPEFWNNTSPLEFGSIPDLFEDVSVIGYPVGGDSLSITSGVVSRIEMQEYAQASAQLLAIQIDAAINPGNSGGPVVNSEDKVIGVAFQSLSEEDIENIGYVVPVSVIKHFLYDVEKHGSYSGVSCLGVRLQGMENQMLRSHCKMSPEDTGILVLSAAPLAPAAKLLQKGDVLLAVDSLRIANDGTIPFTEGSFKERVQLNYYFSMRFPGELVELEVLRNGQRLQISVPLCVPKRLVPRTLLQKNIVDISQQIGTGSKGSIVGGNPSYLVVGGFVFISLSREYLDVEFNPEHMQDFEHCAELLRTMSLSEAMQTEEGEEAVILSHVIASDCNVGYETLSNVLLKTFGGKPVRNLRHLKEMTDEILGRGSATTGAPSDNSIDSSVVSSNSSDHEQQSSQSESLVFELSTGMILVMDRDTAVASQDQICKEHFIPALCSSDLIVNDISIS